MEKVSNMFATSTLVLCESKPKMSRRTVHIKYGRDVYR